MSALLPIAQTDIPDGIIVPCPKFGFDNKLAAKHCPRCEHFHGIAAMHRGNIELPWHQQYAIRCAHIIERRTSSID